MFKLKFLTLASIFLLQPSMAFSTKEKSKKESVVQEILFKSSRSEVIWGMDFIDEKNLIFTTRSGAFYKLNLETKKASELKGGPKPYTSGQGGLLDIFIDKNFKENKFIYFTYSKAIKGGATTALARAKVEEEKLTELQDIFVSEAISSDSVHFGSRIVVDGDGFIYLSIGDRGGRDEAQNLNSHKGKILRLTSTGHLPKDNPFYDEKNTVRSAVWSYGHRNPQGLFFDLKSRILWSAEHGPRGGDEINLIEKGKNYGWPVVTFGREYWGPKIGKGASAPGFVDPLHAYVPSIAPSSLLRYSGKLYKQWEDHFFLGALVLQHINRVRLDVPNKKLIEEERYFQDLARFRNLKEGPSGELYFSTDSGVIGKFWPNEN